MSPDSPRADPALALFQLDGPSLGIVEEWWRSLSPDFRPLAFLTLGSADVAVVAPSLAGQQALKDLVLRLRTAPSSQSLPAVYQCGLNPLEGEHALRRGATLSTLLLTEGASAFKVPAVAGWATDGHYDHAYLLNGNLGDNYGPVLEPLRREGVGTFSIPLIPLEIVLDSSRDIVATDLIVSVVARVEPGSESQTATALRESLKSAIPGSEIDLPKTVYSHGSIDLIIPGPRGARVDLVRFAREIWRLRVEQAHILSVRTHLRAEFEPETQVPPQRPNKGWMYSPFRVPDLATRDHTRQMKAVRKRLAGAKKALSALDDLPLLDVIEIRARVAEGQGHPYTCVVGLDEHAGDRPGLIECFFPEGTLKAGTYDLMAVHEFVSALLGAALAVLKPVLGSDEESWPLGKQEILAQIQRGLGEILGTAINLRLRSVDRPLDRTLSEYVNEVWGSRRELQTGEYLRVLSALFLLRRLEDPEDRDPGVPWLIDIADSASLVESALGPQRCARIFRTNCRLARAVLLGAGLPFDDFDHNGREALVAALADAWTLAREFGKGLVAAYEIGPTDPWTLAGPSNEHPLVGLADIDLLRALLIKEPTFAVALDRTTLVEDAGSGIRTRIAGQYAAAIAELEAGLQKRVSWSRWGGLQLPSLSADERVQTREAAETVARLEQRLRIVTAGPSVGVRPVCRSEELTDPNSLEPAGHEVLTTFEVQADESPGNAAFVVRKQGAERKIQFFQAMTDLVGVGAPAGWQRSVGETALLRRCRLELECLSNQARWLADAPLTPRALVSFNVSPWLFCSRRNPWAASYAEDMRQGISDVIAAARSRETHPVIEITEGPLPQDVDLIAFWDFVRREAENGVVGIAIDDQFGADTDFERMQEIIAAAKTAGAAPIVVKVDHLAVRTLVRGGVRAANVPAHLSQGFTHFRGLIVSGLGDVDIVVFEGLRGWESTTSYHRNFMLTALANLPASPQVLAQG